MFQLRAWLTNICLAAFDLGVTAACVVGMSYLVEANAGPGGHTAPLSDRLASALPLLMLWLLLSLYFGMYRSRRLDSPLADWITILKVALTGWVLAQSSRILFPPLQPAATLTFPFIGANVLVLGAARSALRLSLQWLRSRGHNVKRLLLVASEELGVRIEEKIARRSHYGYRIVSRLSYAPGTSGAEQNMMTQVRALLRAGQVDDVILALPSRADALITKIVAECEGEGINVRIVPDLFPLVQTDTQIYDFDGVPLVNARLYPTDFLEYLVVKRAFDLCVSTVILILFAPLFVVVALLVKATSPGRVFFTQDRVGMNGRRFRIIKFRTMHQTDSLDPDSHWTVDNDRHVTRLGRWLRRSNIDELPQFFNVLKGEMSIVGPRPERPFFLERFKQEIPGYMARHYVKSGITGWAQVNGWRGDTSIPERVAYDLYYIRNWAVSFDVKILLLTLARTVFSGASLNESKQGSLRP
jgi:Undecaprenyl-phosphate glucose phosphotransferase